ncbi:hypothetical protein EFA69_16270 [Rufibacter immobilis]|uniref:Uncharacterized protein n=1 Tax=Rufibacter immobilis TaxID=1348778 RepID=A0A3M9MS06_9BACT|nr:hypothetical protein [Rufibacter immobilis]RNI27673.1 hypothetical protein EFA69_16270 [Rufibacter immobilis]
MTLTAYTNYFEFLATYFRPIGHSGNRQRFARVDIEEVITQLRSRLDLQEPCMLLEYFEGELGGNGGDNHLNQMTGAFYIVQQVRANDLKDENLVLNRCLEYGKEIVARIYKDSEKRTIYGFLKNFRLEKVSYNKVGPLWGNVYGYRFEFPWYDSFAPVTFPNNWSA